jgi:Uma2 family endonuclease
MMKAVMASVPEHILEWRRRSDADQWDEMWEGVLHMAPSPNYNHQDFEGALEMWLRQNWTTQKGCRVNHQINVANPDADDWRNDYRIPDLVLLTPARAHINQNEYFNGGPDAVVEIHSPEDETYEKLDFYFKVGVQEVWIIDRDSKRPEIYERRSSEPAGSSAHQQRQADASGWLRSDVTGVEFRATGDGKLEIRIIDRPESTAKLP